MILLKGAPVAAEITENIRQETEGLETAPCLAFVRVGENAADLSYERAAVKRLQKAGMTYRSYAFPEDITEEAFGEAFRKINEDPEVHGILVFQPLPKHLSPDTVSKNIDPLKDLDGLSELNRAGIYTGSTAFAPCTAESAMKLIESTGIEITGKEAVVIGRSAVIGKPVSMLLLKQNATVTVCHSKTGRLPEIASRADILVVCVGRKEMVDESYIKPGAVVIDVGINEKEDGGITGDVDFESAKEKAGYLTPVPGGVGAVTTSVLAEHLLRAYKAQKAAET